MKNSRRRSGSERDFRDREIFSELRVPPNLHLVLRVDGRAFTSLTDRLGFEKPYDRRFADAMASTAARLVKDAGLGAVMAYTFSDEINLLIPRDRVPFAGRVEKLVSVSASCASAYLVKELRERGVDTGEETISFDSRCIPLRTDEVPGYMAWRQAEAWRNHVNSYGYWALRKKGLGPREAAERLKGMKAHDVHELLYSEFGINLGRTPVWQRRGMVAYKVVVPVRGVLRRRVTVDRHPPFFDDPEGERLVLSLVEKGYVDIDGWEGVMKRDQRAGAG